MINLTLNTQRGAITLVLATIILLTATLLVLFGASFTVLRTKVSSDQLANQQAFMAAEAGLEFGIVYLQQNSATILANPVGGYIPNYTSASTTNVSLANNSKFSIVYSNPTASNYSLILITSTGKNFDGTATRTLSQLVSTTSAFQYLNTETMTILGSMSMSGNSTITNTSTNNNIELQSTLSLSGNANTYTSSGLTSTTGHLGSDITQNAASLNGVSASTFSQDYLGSLTSASFTHTYTNNTSTNYSSSLSGLSGTTIYINQTGGTASITGNTTIGTAANPVLLVVNGPLAVSGNTTIYGFVLIVGSGSLTSDISGNTNITGGIAVGSSFIISGNTNVTYSSTILNAVKNLSGLSTFSKVTGSWKDF